MSNLENSEHIEFLTNREKLTNNLRLMSCIEDICKNDNYKQQFLSLINSNLNLT